MANTALMGSMAESMTSPKPDRWDLRTRIREGDDDLLVLQPGRPVELTGHVGFGLTRLGYHMLAEPSRTAPVAILDVRGWASPLAAWEAGVQSPVFVRCADPSVWSRVLAALLEGVRAVYAEVPKGVRDQDLRRLAALARARQGKIVLRPVAGGLPTGVGHLRLRAKEVHWDGPEHGHGRLRGRRLILEATGKGAAGMTRTIEVNDAGTHDLRVVSDLAVGQAGRAIG